MKLIDSILQDTYDEAEKFLRVADINDLKTQTAIRNLVSSLKSSGLWNKRSIIYPMVGTRLDQFTVNLKNPYTYRLSTFNNFYSISNLGIAATASAGLHTGFNLSQNLNINSASLSYYSQSNRNDSTVEIGCYNSSSFGMALRYSNNFQARLNPQNNFAITDSRGFFIGNRLSTGTRILQNGSLIHSNTTSTSGRSLPNAELQILRDQQTGGNPASKKICSYASAGLGLTPQEEQDYSTIIENFQTALNRSVI